MRRPAVGRGRDARRTPVRPVPPRPGHAVGHIKTIVGTAHDRHRDVTPAATRTFSAPPDTRLAAGGTTRGTPGRPPSPHDAAPWTPANATIKATPSARAAVRPRAHRQAAQVDPGVPLVPLPSASPWTRAPAKRPDARRTRPPRPWPRAGRTGSETRPVPLEVGRGAPQTITRTRPMETKAPAFARVTRVVVARPAVETRPGRGFPGRGPVAVWPPRPTAPLTAAPKEARAA